MTDQKTHLIEAPDKKPLKVELINPPIQDPWRTQGDYREEQRRGNIQFRIIIASLIISMVSVIITAAVAIFTIRSMIQSP